MSVEHFADNQEPISNLGALQIIESTDISNKAQLLTYLRMVMNRSIQNQFFLCSELKKTTMYLTGYFRVCEEKY
jgi:hypothetical protein